MKDKNIAHIIQANEEFMFVCHKDYDQDLDVESSHLEGFKIRIPMRVAPGNN